MATKLDTLIMELINSGSRTEVVVGEHIDAALSDLNARDGKKHASVIALRLMDLGHRLLAASQGHVVPRADIA